MNLGRGVGPAYAIAGLTFRAAIAALLLFVTACGGGGSSPPDVPIPKPERLRTDLRFGYWSGDLRFLVEQCAHVNTWWARADGVNAWHLAIAEQLQGARGCGVKNIALHLDSDDPVWLRFQLDRLSEGGYLTGWDSITVYRWDEPDMPAGGNLSDREVTERVARVRQVLFDTPGLLGAHVGIFYSCASGRRPGIKAFDLVGCFRYDADGCARLEADYAALRTAKAFTARLWLIPSGAHINRKEGMQEPACWASYAHRFDDVWGIIAFMWQSGADPKNDILGIRDIPPMRKLYCETGKTVLRPMEEPRC